MKPFIIFSLLLVLLNQSYATEDCTIRISPDLSQKMKLALISKGYHLRISSSRPSDISDYLNNHVRDGELAIVIGSALDITPYISGGFEFSRRHRFDDIEVLASEIRYGRSNLGVIRDYLPHCSEL